ncbi:MAG: helix-turn-helix domain-containing protein [Acidobacteriota bacterium]
MKFGKTIRKLREERNISIAQFAKRVGMSPTYLAPIERDVFPPPAEDKVIRIAKALGQDPDEFLAMSGRVASDLRRIIRKNPGHTARLLRAIDGLPGEEIERLASLAQTLRIMAKGTSTVRKHRRRPHRMQRTL